MDWILANRYECVTAEALHITIGLSASYPVSNINIRKSTVSGLGAWSRAFFYLHGPGRPLHRCFFYLRAPPRGYEVNRYKGFYFYVHTPHTPLRTTKQMFHFLPCTCHLPERNLASMGIYHTKLRLPALATLTRLTRDKILSIIASDASPKTVRYLISPDTHISITIGEGFRNRVVL